MKGLIIIFLCFSIPAQAKILSKTELIKQIKQGKKDLDLAGRDLSHANLKLAELEGADLRGALLTNADLRGADLTRADLALADLTGANLQGANLTGANLTKAVLYWAKLDLANLSHAYLIEAKLVWMTDRSGDVNWWRANLLNGNLLRVKWWRANFRVNFRGANLKGAMVDSKYRGKLKGAWNTDKINWVD